MNNLLRKEWGYAIVLGLLHPIGFVLGIICTSWLGFWEETETNAQRLRGVGIVVYCLVAWVIYATFVVIKWSGNRHISFVQFFPSHVASQYPFLLLTPFVILALFGELEFNLVGFLFVPMYVGALIITGVLFVAKSAKRNQDRF